MPGSNAPWFDDIPWEEDLLQGENPREGTSSRTRRPSPTTSLSTPERGRYSVRRPTSAPSIYSSPKTNEGVLSVLAAVEQLRSAVSSMLAGVWIQGEVSNFSRAYSGHCYFTLKDKDAQIRCVYFAFSQRQHPVTFRDGDRIEVTGQADVYTRGGELQLRLNDWRAAGAGSLYEAYLQLKARLSAEGLFAMERKKPLPRFVRQVAVVTSAQAAALQDVRRTLARRMPWVKLTLVETLVQGDEAPASIVNALIKADKLDVDAILLVRGGGSFEDLFAFSDERVVRQLVQMQHPVVAGIGHESDESLAGLAADICASTPTAAAEQLGPDQSYWKNRITHWEERIEQSLQHLLSTQCQRLMTQSKALTRFERTIRDTEQRLDQAVRNFEGQFSGHLHWYDQRLGQLERLLVTPQHYLRSKETVLEGLTQRLSVGIQLHFDRLEGECRHHANALRNTRMRVEEKTRSLDKLQQYMSAAMERRVRQAHTTLEQTIAHQPSPATWLNSWEGRLGQYAKTLEGFNPDKVLLRGFSLVQKDGETIDSIAQVQCQDTLAIRLSDGEIEAQVLAKRPHHP